MKVSVVMPVYNAERYLRFSVGSVLNQTHGDWELICVDDGSTDSSGSVLDGYAAQDARVRVVHKPNGGEGSARNAGMDVATGDLIAFLDADDAFHPQALAEAVSVHAETGAEVIRFGWRDVTEHGTPSPAFPGPSCRMEIDFAKRTKSSIFISCLGSTTVVSRDVLRGLRWTDLKQGADLVFALTCFARSRKRWLIDFPMVDYLVRTDSVSHNVSLNLVCGSCRYIPRVVEGCAAVGEGPVAHADTYAYVCDLVWRRLFGAWRLFPDRRDREQVRASFWEMLRQLADQDGFFPPDLRERVRRLAVTESGCKLRLFVVWPYRLNRHFCRRA